MISLQEKIKLEEKNQQKKKILYFVILILSNIIIFISARSNEQERKTNDFFHNGFTKTKIQIHSDLTNSSFQENESKEIIILGNNGELVVAKAFFISKIESNDLDYPIYEIEISNDEFVEFSQRKKQNLLIIKKSQYRPKEKKPSIQKENYEIIF